MVAPVHLAHSSRITTQNFCIHYLFVCLFIFSFSMANIAYGSPMGDLCSHLGDLTLKQLQKMQLIFQLSVFIWFAVIDN